MKTYAPPRPPRHIRVPAFLPVPLRGRADGWTRERQAAFLVALAATRSVAAAARKVGMARQTAYRLRERPGAESFARAWDAVLGRDGTAKWKVTPEERMRRALDGLIRPRVWRGEMRGISTKADNSALLTVLRQLDRGASDADREAGR
jgi:hypothetical protein